MTTNLYGSIIDDDDVHNAVIAFLKKWLHPYLAETFRRKELDFPSWEDAEFSYLNSKSLDTWPETGLPACVVFVPAAQDIEMEGDGTWTAVFPVGLGIVVSSTSQDNTRLLLSAYMSAVKLAFLQHRSMDGFAETLTWRGDDYDVMAFEDEKTIQAGIITLNITVSGVANSNSGPSTPPTDPQIDPGPFGLVQTVDIDVEELPA